MCPAVMTLAQQNVYSIQSYTITFNKLLLFILNISNKSPNLDWRIHINPVHPRSRKLSQKFLEQIIQNGISVFVLDTLKLRRLGVLVEAINTVSTIEREQLEVDFAKKALWELINKGAIAAIQNIIVCIKLHCMTLCHHNSSHVNRLNMIN